MNRACWRQQSPALPWQGNNMSYILEALKKAQAERQLGATPTIHAPTLDAAAPRSADGARWKPLALAAGTAVIAGAAVLLWRQQPAPAVLTSAAQVAATAPVAASPASVAQPAAPAASAAMPLPSAVPSAPPAVAPAQAAVAPVPKAASVPATSSVQAPVQAPAPQPRAAAEAPEEPVQLLRDLPEPIQRSIPQITMGGYMYSRNPADRLVLIDKILRREGEEVAPGLVLEKLLPKAAIFTFKGYRYRVPY
jgi:general secretion pathway protein B